MGEDRIKRRRFLADLLFAGGALTAAALAARAIAAYPPAEPLVMGSSAQPEPIPADTPKPMQFTASPVPVDSGALGGFVVQTKPDHRPTGNPVYKH